MAITDITRESVLAAIDEFDRLGRRAFLDRYGFGEARHYWLVQDGKRYDSKAIVGAAHGYIDADSKPLPASEFSGGDATVGRTLETLGFRVERDVNADADADADSHVVRCEGYEIDLDVLYRAMWERSDAEPGGTRLFVGSGASDRNRPIKRLLNDLFGVPVQDTMDPVNDACRSAASEGLYALGWAEKVDSRGQAQGPRYRSFTYRLYPRLDERDGVGPLVREAVERARGAGAEYPRAHHLDESLLERLAMATHRHAWEDGDNRDGNPSWRTYAGGISGWWREEAGLPAEEPGRLRDLRTDVVEWLSSRGLATRDDPRSTLLRVRDPAAQTSPEWELQPGDVLKRTEIHKRHKGSPGRGISAPAKGGPHRDIMLFFRPTVSGTHGYADGWDEDGRFHYSGMGQFHDQSFDSPDIPENARVRDHRENGDRLRLFRYLAKNEVQYVGEFQLDDDRPWFWRDGEDGRGLQRRVIQFRLVPVGDVDRSADDPVREPGVAASGTTELVTGPPTPEPAALEAIRTKAFQRLLKAQEQVAQRGEAELVHACARWFLEQGVACGGYTIPYEPEGRPLRADLFLYDESVLIEAKATTARSAIRTAIGQLLDYARFFTPERPALAILTPTRPPDDMLELLGSLGIGAIWGDHDQTFARWSPGDRQLLGSLL